jgi:glutathione S-transferase
MKLLSSLTSPFGRKVMAAAIAREIEGQIELVPTNPHISPPSLVDSPVICEYLDTIGDAPKLYPRPESAARWHALKLHAIGDGILEAAVLRRGEQSEPMDTRRATQIERMKAAVTRALDHLEADPPGPGLDIGTLTIACALGYLDFRYAAEPWRTGRPRLAAWLEPIAQSPAYRRTIPRDPA